MTPHSLFVVFEGIDGSGTTTQRRILAHTMQMRGAKVLETAEPSTSSFGLLIRQYLRGEVPPASPHVMAALFAADRALHIETIIDPALRRGEVVICDRFVLSSLAFQVATGVPREYVLQLNHRFYSPDLTVLLTVDPEEAVRRISERGPIPELFEKQDLLRRVQDNYLSEVGRMPEVVRCESPVPKPGFVQVDTGRTFLLQAADLVVAALDEVCPDEFDKSYPLRSEEAVAAALDEIRLEALDKTRPTA